MDIRKAILALLFIIYPERTGSASRCVSYPDPKNGYITCDSLFHLFCSPECHPGYRFATKPAVVYMCGPVTGEWFTYPVGSALPWPDCVREDRADNTIHEELAKKREEITKHIAGSNTGIPSPYYSQARMMDPEERYHHLFDYIERAQKVYEYREALEKETEKLKHENVEQKNVNYNSQNGSLRDYVGWPPSPLNIVPKTWLTHGNNSSRKEDVSTNGHETGLPKGHLQQTMVARKELVQRQDQSHGDKNNPISNKTTNVPRIVEKENGFLAANGNFTEEPRASNSLPNLQFQMIGNPQNNAISSEDGIETKEDKTNRYKQDSNFVLKMLNNEEFKDLHYLDEHIRLNRDAPTSSPNNKPRPMNSKMLGNDKRVGRESVQNHQHLEFENSKVDTKDSRSRDNSSAKTITVKAGNEDFSSHVVPIVMSGQSLLQSFSSLLKNANTPEKRKVLHPLVEQEQNPQNKEKQSKNSNSVASQDFTLKENYLFLINKSNIQQNVNRQSLSESSHMNTKALYESWLKRNRTSMVSNINNGQKKDIFSPRKIFPEKEVEMSVQNSNAYSMKMAIQEGKPLQGKEENDQNRAQTPREHLFYFPIKKDKLIEILKQRNIRPKT